MARKKGRARKVAMPRDPYAWALAARSGNAAGKHKQGAKRPKGKGSRSQKRAKAIREHY